MPGGFGKKLALGITSPIVLGSIAGVASPSTALAPTLLTLAPTAGAPTVEPNNDALLGGCCGSDCGCRFVIICTGARGGEEGIVGLDVGVP